MVLLSTSASIFSAIPAFVSLLSVVVYWVGIVASKGGRYIHRTYTNVYVVVILCFNPFYSDPLLEIKYDSLFVVSTFLSEFCGQNSSANFQALQCTPLYAIQTHYHSNMINGINAVTPPLIGVDENKVLMISEFDHVQLGSPDNLGLRLN